MYTAEILKTYLFDNWFYVHLVYAYDKKQVIVLHPRTREPVFELDYDGKIMNPNLGPKFQLVNGKRRRFDDYLPLSNGISVHELGTPAVDSLIMREFDACDDEEIY